MPETLTRLEGEEREEELFTPSVDAATESKRKAAHLPALRMRHESKLASSECRRRTWLRQHYRRDLDPTAKDVRLWLRHLEDTAAARVMYRGV